MNRKLHSQTRRKLWAQIRAFLALALTVYLAGMGLRVGIIMLEKGSWELGGHLLAAVLWLLWRGRAFNAKAENGKQQIRKARTQERLRTPAFLASSFGRS